MKKVEILAPAGSFASLTSAINAGADAIYLGVGDLNMRASSAVNFKVDDLKEISQIAKKHKIKIYITVNNLIFDNEKEKIYKIIDEVKKHDLDAIIAADMATILYARQVGVEVHISTQMAVANIETVKFYSKFSDRIVLARELTLEQIKEICDQIKSQDIRGPRGDLVEIEIFAHGALCVAVSGRCGMSLYTNNTSASRGKCSQLCRRQYKVTDVVTGKELVVDNNYIMSSADLCTIGMLPEILSSGISVLKFEGRGRSPEYVDMVISTYKEAIDAVYKNKYTQKKIDKWNQELGTVFNRGFTTNFFMGKPIGEWAGIHGSRATEIKIQIGKVTKYYPKIKVVQILILAKETVKSGSKYLIIGDKTGVVKGKLEKMVCNDKEIEIANQSDEITFKLEKQVRVGDVFYILKKNTSTISRGKEHFVK